MKAFKISSALLNANTATSRRIRPLVPTPCPCRRCAIRLQAAGKSDKSKKSEDTEDLLKAGVSVVGDLAKTYLAADPKWKVVGSMAEKLMEPGPSNSERRSQRIRRRQATEDARDDSSGTYTLAAALVAIYVMKNELGHVFFKSLYLNHVHPSIYQFFSSTLCASSWVQLSTVAFYLYVFGRMIERSHGWFGIWAAYLTSGAGASLARYMLLPAKVGKAALMTTGAVSSAFGLFLVSLLLRPSLSWRRFMEVLLVGQFVVRVAAADATQPVVLQLVSVLGQKIPAQYVDLVGAAAGAVVFCLGAAAVDWVRGVLSDEEGRKR